MSLHIIYIVIYYISLYIIYRYILHIIIYYISLYITYHYILYIVIYYIYVESQRKIAFKIMVADIWETEV